jgi:hypothetical protein
MIGRDALTTWHATRRRGRAVACGAVAALLAGAMVAAQAPSFAGTWKLDAENSKVTAAAGLAGLVPNGAPVVLHITQPANGTLVVESQINEGHSRMYRPNAKTSTPVGQGGSITMTSTFKGRTIISEGSVQTAAGATTAVKETYTLSADGQSLSVDVAVTGGAETLTQPDDLRQDHRCRPM